MADDEQTRAESRKKLIQISKPGIDDEQIQYDRRNRDFVGRQLDGWRAYSSDPGVYSGPGGVDGAHIPWRTYPVPLTGRRSLRLLMMLLAGMVIAFVLIFIVGLLLI